MQRDNLTSSRARQCAAVVVRRWLAAGAACACTLALGACEKTTTATGGKVGSIEVAPTSIALTPGRAAPLTARVLDESGSPINVQVFWAEEDARVARVSSHGIVTAVAPGRTQVAASRSGLSAVVPVVVSALPPTLLRVTPNATQMTVGGSTTLLAEVFDASGAKVNGVGIAWSSGALSVATVNSSGVVTAVGPGSALISAAGAGLTGAAFVSVQGVPVSTISVAPSTANVQVGRTMQLRATLRDAAGNILTGRAVAWTSDNILRATVLPTGIVTGVSKGSVRITASSEGKTASSSISVR
ncbi:MAG: Ig-like domain-containing protein [Gemmatimonadota bacterium]